MALTSALELAVQTWFNALTISGYTKYYSFAADFRAFPFAVCESFDQQEYTQLSSMRSSLNSYKIVFALCDKLIKDNIKASLETKISGNNNDLIYTSVTGSDIGNNYSIKYVLKSIFSVSVSGTDYTVNFTGSTTAKIVMDYFNTNYSTTFTVKFADGNDGTGLISTMAKSYLTGGITNGELFVKDKLQKQWEDIFESSSSTVRAKTDMKEYTRTVRDETELLILYAVLTIPKT